jgi:hypothetical protein
MFTINFYQMDWTSRYTEDIFQLFYKIKPTNNFNSNISEADVITNCLKYILILIQVIDRNIQYSWTENYELKSTDNPNNLSYTFTNKSSSFKAYKFKMGYQQKEPFSAVVINDNSFSRATCFGTPSYFSWNSTSFSNGSYLIEWSEPSDLGAPFICYYELSIRLPKGQMMVYQTQDRYFQGTAMVPYPFHMDVQLSAVNNYTCYVESTYPVFKGCSQGYSFNTTKSFSIDVGVSSNSNSIYPRRILIICQLLFIFSSLLLYFSY